MLHHENFSLLDELVNLKTYAAVPPVDIAQRYRMMTLQPESSKHVRQRWDWLNELFRR